jgi:AAA domain
VFVDDARGLIQLKRGPSLAEAPHPRALIPGTPVPTQVLEDAVFDVAQWVADHGIDAPGPHLAVRDLLLRTPSPSLTPDNGSYLAIQGPPGSGKTWEGARLITELVRDGKRVGITAHSHAAIGKLLDETVARARRENVPLRAVQKAEDHQRASADGVEFTDNNAVVADALITHSVDVAAGTAWLWARADMANLVDVLFVDEASQKSLADVVAISRAAKSIVLLGDPQQLSQPSKGSHPDGVAVSALEYLLDGAETMPRDLGLFLDMTWRMHPKVCAFVSEVAYDGRLQSIPGLEQQSVDGRAGLIWVPVEHAGNRTASTEEAVRVRGIIDDLVGEKWTDKHGVTHELTLDDVLVVAPYNAHVARLQQHLPEGARIGTVDKFQGQEAPVTIYSMATSTTDDAPRGIEFLYDLRRLNVAVSRARALSITVCRVPWCARQRRPGPIRVGVGVGIMRRPDRRRHRGRPRRADAAWRAEIRVEWPAIRVRNRATSRY